MERRRKAVQSWAEKSNKFGVTTKLSANSRPSRCVIPFIYTLLIFTIPNGSSIFVYTGTGKSEIGAHIAYILAMANRQMNLKTRGQQCVLYCGPSNKSVDIVLRKQ